MTETVVCAAIMYFPATTVLLQFRTPRGSFAATKLINFAATKLRLVFALEKCYNHCSALQKRPRASNMLLCSCKYLQEWHSFVAANWVCPTAKLRPVFEAAKVKLLLKNARFAFAKSCSYNWALCIDE